MSDDKFQNKYRIESARAWWHNYDGGSYFITICTKHREHFFGEIEDGVMLFSDIGKYASEQFRNVSSHYPYAEIALFTVMPNHVHAIVIISAGRDGVHTVSTTKTDAIRWLSETVNETMQEISHKKGRLSVVIGGLKRAVTHYVNENEFPFSWQSRFHDHIIRDTSELNRVATYIENNVANWKDDEFYTPR